MKSVDLGSKSRSRDFFLCFLFWFHVDFLTSFFVFLVGFLLWVFDLSICLSIGVCLGLSVCVCFWGPSQGSGLWVFIGLGSRFRR